MFTLQANRQSVGNMLYTTAGKLIVINQNGITSDYYITQYDYSTGTIEIDLNVGAIEFTSLFGCECDVFVTDVDGNLYTLVNTTSYELLSLDINIGITSIRSATQVGSCVYSSITES
jgi:hypothetical protein